jgi:D-arabinose 1-dehydrogenase-like Zn-dependent alcohol dehydrogenase
VRELYQRHRRILGAPMGSWRDFVSVMRLAFAGAIAPVVDSVYPLADAAQAHRRAESAESFGKVVLASVSTPPCHPDEGRFSAHGNESPEDRDASPRSA